MSYRLSHIGEAVVEADQPRFASPMQQAVMLMGVAAVPWLPVLALGYAGRRWKGTDGAWIGALSGFALSTLALRSLAKVTGT